MTCFADRFIQGVGLTTEEKEVLFERFAQASPRTHAHYGGSGLGLFISRQLAELHGGRIGVSSEAGVGSTFGFFLQCKRMHDKTRPDLERTPSTYPQKPDHVEASRDLVASVSGGGGPSNEPEMPHRKELEQLHILVVEDNIINQKVLSKGLTKLGCVVTTADHGLMALEHLAKTYYCREDGIPLSVILMDLEMPEMDGLTCCRHIREMEKEGKIKQHVPVLALTANVREEQITIAKASGMDDLVRKPFRVREVLNKINTLLKELDRQ